MAEKPKNHVTLEQDARRALQGDTPWPEVPEDLLQFLEATHPPRCYTATAESLEAHLQYAGMVDLVATLRSVFEFQKQSAIELDDDQEDGQSESASVTVGLLDALREE